MSQAPLRLRRSQTARYRHHVNVTLTVPQETLMSCFHRSHQLSPGSNAVSVYLTCLDCQAPGKVDSSNGTHIPAISGDAANGSKRGGQNCNDDKDDVFVPVDGWNNVLSGPCYACAAWSVRPIIRLWTPFTSIPGTVVTIVEQRVQRRFRRNRVDLVELGGQVTNPEDQDTAVRLRGYKTQYVQQHRLATVSDQARWRES